MINNPKQHIILVSGATGHQGSALSRHLLDKGFSVRALTRKPDSDAAHKLADAGAEITEGNFDDRASLDRAFDGVYGAFSVQNSMTAGIEGETRQGCAFADAAKEAGVQHFIYSSVGGAERRTGIPHFDSKWEIEKYIHTLDLPATILRPVFFMNNWLGFKDVIHSGKLPQPLSPDTSLQQIAVDDIGAFATLAFSNPDKYIGKAIELAGDELTMKETAEAFSEATGKEVEYVQIPWEAFEKQAGEEFAAMFRWFEDKGYEAEIAALRKEYPDLKTLKLFLDKNKIF